MTPRLRRGLVVLAILAVGFPVAVVAVWLALPQYDAPEVRLAAGTVRDDTVTVVSDDWTIAREGGGAEKLKITLETATEIDVGGEILIALGHVLPTEQRIYVPFSITTAPRFFFETNYLRDIRLEGGDFRVEEPSPARAFMGLFRYIRYKRSERGENSPDNLMRVMDAEYGARFVANAEVPAGSTLTIEFGATEGLAPPHREAEWQVVTRMDHDADGTFELVADAPSFRVRARRLDRVELVAPTTMRVGETSLVVARPMDDYFLPNLVDVKDAALSLEALSSLDFPTEVSWDRPPPDDPHAAWQADLATFEVTAMEPGVHRLRGTARVDGTRVPVESNPIVVTRSGRQVYFGDTHLHSILSYDADRPPDWVYWRQRRQERHDFAFLSDHDMIGSPGFSSLAGIQGRTDSEWAYIRQLADQWNEPSKFATLTAHEWTSYFYGHRNLYYGPDEPDPVLVHHNRRSESGPEDSQTPSELRERLGTRQYLVIPHSSAWPTADTKYHWGPPDWEEQRLVEIYSTHGTSAYFDNEYAVDDGHREIPTDSRIVELLMNYDIQQAPADSGNFVRDELARGRRMGFVGSSDMHFLSHVDQAYKPGFAAVWTDDLSREKIWEALRARRTYATTAARIFLAFSLDETPMGGVVAPGSRELRVEVHATAPVEELVLHSHDEAGWSSRALPAEGRDIEHRSPFDAREGSLHYLEVRQKDGNRAWASPIWVDRSGETEPP